MRSVPTLELPSVGTRKSGKMKDAARRVQGREQRLMNRKNRASPSLKPSENSSAASSSSRDITAVETAIPRTTHVKMSDPIDDQDDLLRPPRSQRLDAVHQRNLVAN